MKSGKTDEIKGRIKEAAGVLVDDGKMKREGQVDQLVGKVKQNAEKAFEKARHAAGAVVLGGLMLAGLAQAGYAASDTWIATKIKVALLTTDGAGRNAVKSDTDKGMVTLHGKVETQAVKDKAEATVRKVDGVKSVRNLVQVVPESMEKYVEASDKEIKDGVEVALRGNTAFENVKVDSVDKGVVLLSGKTTTWESKLLAIETADRVPGARRVSSLIESDEK